MASSTKFVQKLLEQSKKLTDANVKKCQNERILKELTLFQNLSNFCKDKNKKTDSDSSSGGRKSELEKVFKVEVKVYPSPLRTVNSSQCNETLMVTVENISKSFSFSCNHWQFVLDFNDGQEVSSWSLENDFDPGKCESFSTSFFTRLDISPIDLRLRILFTMSHLDQTFVKSLDIYKTFIDILHLITPTRYQRAEMWDFSAPTGELGAVFPSKVAPKKSTLNQNHHKRVQHDHEEEEEDEIPSITQFFFKFDPPLLKSFVKCVLLQDSKSRWLSMKSEGETDSPDNSPMFPIYYLEDEILVTVKSNLGTVAFKSSNPKVLCALKVAILKRLMGLENIKVSSNDASCEKLYCLRLRLEEMSRLGRAQNVREYVDIYLDLRDVSETLEFSCGGGSMICDDDVETID